MKAHLKPIPPKVEAEIQRQREEFEANTDPPDRWSGFYDCIFWQACEKFGLDPHDYRSDLPKTYDMLTANYRGWSP